MLTYEDRLNKIKSPDDLDKQIDLAYKAEQNQRRKMKRTIKLADKIVEKRKIRDFERVWYDLKLNYFDILDSLD